MNDTLIICITLVILSVLFIIFHFISRQINNPYTEEIIGERHEHIYSQLNPNRQVLIYTIRRSYKNGKIKVYTSTIEH